MVAKLRPKSEFTRNVLTLLTGTTIAQAIPIAISPILTRIYSPSEFGVFALYMAVVSIVSVLATGRYEQAVMLPKKDTDAANIVILAIIITCTISIILLLVIIVFNPYITKALGNPEIAVWLYLTPVSVLITGIYQTLNYWNNRKKQYKVLAQNRVIQNTSVSSVHVLGGLASLSVFALVIGDIIGRISATLLLLKSTLKNDRQLFMKSDSKQRLELAKRYKKFPIFDTSASLANIASYQVQNIAFPLYFGLASAGHYFLVLRVMQAPLSLISASLTDVYKQKITSKSTTDKQLKSYYIRMFLFLFLTGIIPFSLLFFYAEELFSIVFGREWRVAGSYASILAPLFFIRFIASPLSYFLYLKEKLEINVIGNVFLFLSVLFSIFLSTTAKDAVILISILFSIIYAGYILYSAKLAGVFKAC